MASFTLGRFNDRLNLAPVSQAYDIGALTHAEIMCTWATTSALNTARDYSAGCGDTSAALSFGGNPGSPSSVTEKWSGSSWATTSMDWLVVVMLITL